MKKVLTLTIVAAMSISVLAGCSKAAPAANNNTNTNSNTTAAAGNLKDGKYSAAFDHIDGKGWKPFLEIEVKGGKIEKANFNYKSPDGKLKTDDANYEKSMKAKNGLGPVEYVPKINEAFVKKQAAEIDTVTGATHSVENAKALAKALLEKAAKGDTSETVIQMNDTYTATAKDFDERGWKPQVSVTYKDGKITSVVYEELNKEGKKKTEDTQYNTQMKAASKVSMKEAAETLGKKYLETGKVDTVAGATTTSKNFADLVQKAIDSRK
ncbi:FMN-binding protein [Clostridium sp. YIM B02515]|uniref:FMN-binding protein n=1 Tax=Clostridium rhizosphaerae TaxID=2803861 RepID=A0ABS1T7B5_9CLOT|nr:FMN-binding protein [Clostridium rhizosphaerae]MBL4935236.1 FMN-binding protein [Clostridium rhizosphaerae]